MGLIIVSIVVVLAICYYSYIAYYKKKVVKNLYELLRERPVILDVRTETEYKSNHLENSINIPIGRLKNDHKNLDKNATIITCCSHGIRSVKAANILQNKGFKNVFNGGAWTQLKSLIK